MNYDVFEHYLVGYLLLKPSFRKKVDVSIIKRESFRDILKLAEEIHKTDDPVSIIALKAAIQAGRSKVLPIEVDMVYDLMGKELAMKTEREIYDEIRNIVDYLVTRHRRNTSIDALKHAIALIEQGKETEGILAAKTIKFSDASPLRNTLDLMSDSIEETNIFKTGIPEFDDQLHGFAKGNMMSIAGDTGSMKTMISLWLCIQILKANPKFKCLYFEKEMPVKDIARRLAAYSTSMTITELMDTTKKVENKYTIIQAMETDEEMKDVMNRLQIVPNQNFHNVSDMYRYIDTYQADIWCLDFLTQLGAEDTNQDFNRFTMAQASMLKNIIAETDSFGIVLNQVKKNGVRTRTNKIPTLDDIEWSGAISQYSAYIFSTFFPSVYYADAPEEYFYLYGLKNRHYKPVNIHLHTMPKYCQFSTPTSHELPMFKSWLHGYITKSQEKKFYGKY